MALLSEKGRGLFVAFNASMTHPLTIQRRTLAAFFGPPLPSAGTGAGPEFAAHVPQPRRQRPTGQRRRWARFRRRRRPRQSCAATRLSPLGSRWS